MNKEQQIEELHDFILNNLYKGSTHLLAEKLYMPKIRILVRFGTN